MTPTAQTRYCSTCGTLLTPGAAVCGECGARYQESPYERRATDAPGAWSQAPAPRRRDLGAAPEAPAADEGIELISRESLQPKAPGATTLREQDQYDRMMVTQPGSPAPSSGPSSAPVGGFSSPASAAPGEPSGAPAAPGTAPLPEPLDGCVPAPPLKRVLAALVDGVVQSLVLLPLTIGVVLVVLQEGSTLSQILVGIGVALPVAYTVLIVWLQGSKGVTAGKAILGLRTTRASAGGPIGFLRALGRAVLYGVVPPVMALSVFLDPAKHLRGVHDRVVDSVVVDAKAGRNPMKPRADDFERKGAEHYLGASSVPVTAHENLLSTPGAAWAPGDQQQPSAPAADSGWGPSASEQGWGSPAPAEQSWGAPSPSAPAGQSWDAPGPSAPAEPSWGAPATPAPAQPSWGTPEQAAPAQQTWDAPEQSAPPAGSPWATSAAPGPAPTAPAADPSHGWGPPPAAAEAPAAEPAPSQPAPAPSAGPAGWGPPAAPEQEPPAPEDPAPGSGSVPGELTGDAWGADAAPSAAGTPVDERTHLSAGPDEDLGDLEATRVSAVQLPPTRSVRVTADDGSERVADRPLVIGRNPGGADGEVLFVLQDETRSVSKTHLRLDATGDDVVVTDLGSTNGSAILHADGTRSPLVPNDPAVLPEGATLTLGDRSLTVERES